MAETTIPPEAAGFPVPPDHLMERVGGTADHGWFFSSGRESVRELERILNVADRSLASFESVLDFGCGCGRMLLWMGDLPKTTTLHGTDIDAELVAWVQENIDYVTATVNGHEPPLPFADASFDLVFNHSVFTHIDERRQDAWLAELQRVVRPDGLLVLSVHGEIARRDDENLARQLEDRGIVFVDETTPPAYKLPDWYQSTYHAPWYVFERWSRWFEIVAYLPGSALGFQDQVLLRRIGDHRPPRRPLAPRTRRVDDVVAPAAAPLADPAAARAAASERPSRFGLPGRAARKLAVRAAKPVTAHQDAFNAAAAQRVAELEARIAELERRDQQR